MVLIFNRCLVCALLFLSIGCIHQNRSALKSASSETQSDKNVNNTQFLYDLDFESPTSTDNVFWFTSTQATKWPRPSDCAKGFKQSYVRDDTTHGFQSFSLEFFGRPCPDVNHYGVATLPASLFRSRKLDLTFDIKLSPGLAGSVMLKHGAKFETVQ